MQEGLGWLPLHVARRRQTAGCTAIQEVLQDELSLESFCLGGVDGGLGRIVVTSQGTNLMQGHVDSADSHI